ncbi:MAG TPA: 2-phosphosulfolactate phosphatase [Rhodopila sp.]
MDIVIGSLLEGARQAAGAVAIIDVFRAFTCAAVALANGAAKIVMVSTIEEAFALRDGGIGQVCVGEVGGRPPDGFDFGNSPFEVSRVAFAGQTIIQRTSAGTQGITAAAGADRLFAASLVTARATARALEAAGSARITLVAMGDSGIERTDEDELCALHLRNLLQGRRGDPDAVRRLILAGGEIARFNDPARPYLYPEDVEIALDVDRYDFAIRVRTEEGRLVARSTAHAGRAA